MIGSYLKNRLTESKLSSKEWVALAQVLEEFWQLHFNKIDDFEADKNIFTASNSELEKKIREFGDYFDVELPFDDSTKRLSIAWQRDRIHQKNTLSPFILALKLNFAGLPVEWVPLYCLADYTKENLISEPSGDAWLTSRGTITIDLSHLKKIGMGKEQFTEIVEREIKRLKPAHIVYDGISFIIYIEFNYEPLVFGVDSNLLSEPKLDYQSNFVVDNDLVTIEPSFDFALKRMWWSLDQFITLPNGRVPLPGVEGDVIEIFDFLAFKENQANFNASANLASDKEKNRTTPFQFALDERPIHHNSSIELPISTAINPDPTLSFDAIPADFIPLDTPFWEAL